MIISIDIGTSYSTVCLLNAEGKAEPVETATGISIYGSKYSLPSAVFVEEDGKVLVGQAAMNSRKWMPQNFRSEFKRDLGQNIPIVLGNRSFLPEELYTEMFRHMKACAERSGKGDIEKAVITYPASYGKTKREKIKQAAKNAGMFDTELLDEPTAAAMCYGAKGCLKNGDILLVYDFGGGTFDASVILYADGRYEPLAPAMGIEHCGGIDIDRAIYADMMSKISAGTLQQLSANKANRMRFENQLAELAVKIKHHLSAVEHVKEAIPVGFDILDYELDRGKLNTFIASTVSQTLDCCRNILDSAGIAVRDISEILLVGGTSRVPLVQEMLRQFAGDVPIHTDADPDLAVAMGALEEAEYTPESDDEISGHLYISNDGFYIDRAGKTIFHRPWPCPWDHLSRFSEGLACVERVGKSSYNEYGYIDKTGKLVIPYQWSWAHDFSEGLAYVSKDGQQGYIDKTGKLVIACQWDSADVFSEGLARVNKDGKYGYIDKTGKLVIPRQWDYADNFSEGLACVNKDGKYGYIDKTGKLVIACQWDSVHVFSEGLACVKRDDKWGFIDKTGKLVIACQWDSVHVFSEGLACVKRDDKWGFIDKTDKLAIPCRWDYADNFSEGLARVKENENYGYIDKTGELAIPCQWWDAGNFSEGLAFVEKHGGMSLNNTGYIDKTGKLVIPYQWSSARQFEKGVAQVDKYEGLLGFTENHYIIDKNGRIISKIYF